MNCEPWRIPECHANSTSTFPTPILSSCFDLHVCVSTPLGRSTATDQERTSRRSHLSKISAPLVFHILDERESACPDSSLCALRRGRYNHLSNSFNFSVAQTRWQPDDVTSPALIIVSFARHGNKGPVATRKLKIIFEQKRLQEEEIWNFSNSTLDPCSPQRRTLSPSLKRPDR